MRAMQGGVRHGGEIFLSGAGDRALLSARSQGMGGEYASATVTDGELEGWYYSTLQGLEMYCTCTTLPTYLIKMVANKVKL